MYAITEFLNIWTTIDSPLGRGAIWYPPVYVAGAFFGAGYESPMKRVASRRPLPETNIQADGSNLSDLSLGSQGPSPYGKPGSPQYTLSQRSNLCPPQMISAREKLCFFLLSLGSPSSSRGSSGVGYSGFQVSAELCRRQSAHWNHRGSKSRPRCVLPRA